jgi:hypothetical protein
VLPEMKETADRNLVRSCKKLIRQQWYNAKHYAINHFQAKKGVRSTKADNVENKEDLEMTVDDYVVVSELSMRFYVVAKFQLRNVFLKRASL